MKTSLRRRLTVTHTLVAIFAVLLMAILASGLIARAFNDFSIRQARLISQNLAGPLGNYYVRTGSWEHLNERLLPRSGPALGPLLRRMVITDPNWRVVYDSNSQNLGATIPLRMRPQAARIQTPQGLVGYVLVPQPTSNLDDEETRFFRSVFFIVLVGIFTAGGGALLIALLVARHMTRPLRSLTEAARRLAAGERHQPLTPPADAELAELAAAFNTMAAELAKQEQLRRQMVADIAHELRTPISVLRLQVESLEDGIEPATPQSYAALGHEVDLLSRLVDDLRLLTLADSGKLALTVEPVDVQAAITRAAAAAGPRARRQGIELRVEPNGTLPPACADAQRLAQVLGNLVENALRYTPQGGSVTLRAHDGGNGNVLMEISDTGPGIAPADLPLIFDRFFRSDRARARETGGSGLGLAIVQRLVEAHGGRIDVESEPGRGSTFRISLPAMDRL
jgi:signal transduction histidine kinase